MHTFSCKMKDIVAGRHEYNRKEHDQEYIEDTVDHYVEIKAGCLLIDEHFQIFIILDLTNEGVAEV